MVTVLERTCHLVHNSVLVSTWPHHICRTPWDSIVISQNRPDTKLCEGLVHQSASFRTLRTRLEHERESGLGLVFFLKYQNKHGSQSHLMFPLICACK